MSIRAKDHTKITPEQAADLLSYDPETGVIRWRVHRGRYHCKGKVAGSLRKDGYINIRVGAGGGGFVLAHRMAWVLAHGEWPAEFVDHINGDRSDNRLCNLRLATKQQNNANSASVNKTGFRGVTYVPQRKATKKFMASIRVDGKGKTLGYFHTAEEAHAAWAAAAKKRHGKFARVENALANPVEPQEIIF